MPDTNLEQSGKGADQSFSNNDAGEPAEDCTAVEHEVEDQEPTVVEYETETPETVAIRGENDTATPPVVASSVVVARPPLLQPAVGSSAPGTLTNTASSERPPVLGGEVTSQEPPLPGTAAEVELPAVPEIEIEVDGLDVPVLEVLAELAFPELEVELDPIVIPELDFAIELEVPEVETETPSTSDQASDSAGSLSAPPRPSSPALRLLMWNIFELGGGFYRSHQRSQYAIDAYAAIIAKLDVDIAVLLGLTSTPGRLPAERTHAGHSCLVMNDGPSDTGPSEAARIAAALRERDPASGWTLTFPQAGKRYLYHRGATTCFLHRKAKGIELTSLDIVDSKADDALGLTGKLVLGSFRLSATAIEPFFLAAPLGVPLAQRELEKPPPAGSEEDLAPTCALPESFLLAVSAAAGLADTAGFADLGARVDAPYLSRGAAGTALNDEFWKTTIASKDGLLGNFAAVDAGNLDLRDQQSHWEAMEPLAHAETLGEVTGGLADGFLVCGAGAAPTVEEMRAVSLLAAAIPEDHLERAGRERDPSMPEASPIEDSILLAQRQAYREEDLGGGELAQDAANELAECCYFSLTLSRRWPVVAQLRPSS